MEALATVDTLPQLNKPRCLMVLTSMTAVRRIAKVVRPKGRSQVSFSNREDQADLLEAKDQTAWVRETHAKAQTMAVQVACPTKIVGN